MILFITGPSGAGKTTLAHAWVKSRQYEVGLIDADQITSWMRLGDRSAVEAAFAEGPVARIAEQYRITAEVYAAVAGQYARNGIDVVIAQLCGYDPPPPWSKGWDLLEALEPVFVVLYPERETCRERLVARGSSPDTGTYDFGWPQWRDHPRALFLDNTSLSLAESVAALDQLLEQRVDMGRPLR